MKAYGWYQKLHDENSPEYKAAMEELIRESVKETFRIFHIKAMQ